MLALSYSPCVIQKVNGSKGRGGESSLIAREDNIYNRPGANIKYGCHIAILPEFKCKQFKSCIQVTRFQCWSNIIIIKGIIICRTVDRIMDQAQASNMAAISSCMFLPSPTNTAAIVVYTVKIP